MGSHEVSDRIGEKAVRFVFLRLSPRVEIPTLIARIREVLGESVAVSDARTVLGIFDVLVEYRVDTIAPDFSKLGTLPGVTNSAEFICYEWVAERGQAPGSLPSDYPLSVFTLLRLHSDALSQGLHAERELVERIEGTLSLREGRPYSVFGSLGPAELVVVTYGRSMVDLAAGLRHLSLAIHRDGDQPLVSKSLSFVCASSIVFESPTITRSEEAMAFWERLASERALLADSGGAIPHLLVDTDASKHGEITRWVGDRCGSSGPFGTVDTVLGLHDLLVRPGRQANWRDFLWGCLELRRIFSDVIQATTLVIGLPHPTLPTGRASSETIPEERSSGPLTVDLTATQADAMIGTLGEPLGEAVVNAIYTYNSMVHGDPQSHGLRDIHPFVAELCRSATEPKADRQKRLKLGYCVELLRSGLHHHSAGAFHGIDRPAWRIIAVQGGLQRVTVGITHALRRLIMRHFGERWEGFATISTAHRGFYNALGVINIPINAFGDISHLWTLLHEIGHLASEGFWEKTGLTKAVDDFLGQIHETPTALERRKWNCLFQEVACDLFAFRLVFEGERLPEIEAKIEQRLASAYTFDSDWDYVELALRIGCIRLESDIRRASTAEMTEVLGFGRPTMRRFIGWFRAYESDLRRTFEGLGEQSIWDLRKRRYVKSRLFAMRFPVYRLHQAMGFVSYDRRSSDAEARVARVLDDRIVDFSRPDPTDFFARLPYCQERLGFGATAAMLLTFWHDAMVQRAEPSEVVEAL